MPLQEGEQSIIRRRISSSFLDASKFVFDAAFNTERDLGDINRAIQLAAEGNGTIINYTHSKKVDPFLGIRVIRELPVLQELYTLAPIAKHQMLPGLGWVGELYAVEPISVITESTLKKEPHTKEEIAEYLRRYLERAEYVLSKGGIVLVAPQATRKPVLGDPTTAASMLINRLVKKGIHNVSIFSLGINPEEETARRWDIRARFSLKGGSTHTLDELNELIDQYIKEQGITQIQGSGLKRQISVQDKVSPYILDHAIFGELARLVPPSYLNPPSA